MTLKGNKKIIIKFAEEHYISKSIVSQVIAQWTTK